MFGKRYCNIYIITPRREFSTEIDTKPLVELDPKTKSDIAGGLKPRKHAGVTKIGTIFLPESIVAAAKLVFEDYPAKTLLNDAKSMANYLFSRHHPLEKDELYERRAKFTENVKSRLPKLSEGTSEDEMNYNKVVRSSVANLMKKYNYQWSSLDLNNYSCIVYLLTRAAPNYATVMKVLTEIKRSCPDYKPTSLFDFGSGIGTVSWAARSVWGQSLDEVVNIDSSSSMNDLAELLLKGGKSTSATPSGVHYRQFLPAQHRRYSLVVSAHSLMELPSRDNRLEHLLNLWNKTTDYLIIIEQGTKPGYKMVLEARDFILSLSRKNTTDAYVFAPCPHDVSCPRTIEGPDPCNFELLYCDFPLNIKQIIKRELYSYVIMKKGRRPEENNWPRVVRPVLQRHKHVICRFCTSEGNLREEIFTKNKHGAVLYKCAKVTNWGDRLPVTLPPATSNVQPEDTQTESKLNEHVE